MRYLKKMLAGTLALSAALQILAMPAWAVEEETKTETKKEKSLVISLEETPEKKSDFVTEFPEIEPVETAKAVRPSAELLEQERQEYVYVPLYYQNDYPEILYGSGTVATSGCGIVSLAMMATYLTGYEYLPDELAYYFGGRAENNMQRLEMGAEALGLPYEKPENWHGTLAALEEGKLAIVLVNSRSTFSDSQHFIVLTGLTEDGKVMVNDPYKPNYDRWDLQAGFMNGFEEVDIVTGYEGAWVFDKAAMPEEITRYCEIEPERGEPRYPEIDLTFAERQLLARVIWVEARGESAEGQQAVAEVVLNRLHSENYPNTLRNVIYAEGQFRSVPYLEDAEPGQAQYKAIEDAIYGPYILPEDVTYFATFKTNDQVWGTIGGHIFCYDDRAETDTEK